MTWTITITECFTSNTENITSNQWSLSRSTEEGIERFEFTVDYNIQGEGTGETGFIGGETNPLVLLKMGSQVDLYKGAVCWFHGFIYEDPTFVTADQREIRCVCYCPKYRLRRAQIPVDGELTWAQESGKIKLENVPLMIAVGYNVGDSRTYFPAVTGGTQFDDATYLGVSDTLVSDLGATIRVGIADTGFAPRGFILLDRLGAFEIAYYDGYFFNGTNWEFRNVVRAELGTTLAAHVPGKTVEQLVFKEITQEAEVLEGYPVDKSWLRIPYSQFTKNYLLGGFTLNRAYDGNDRGGGAGGDNLRGTYTIYDEDNPATVLLLEALITTIVTADRNNRGAGFTVPELNFDALNVAINKYSYDARTRDSYALECINNLIRDLQIDVLLYWDSTAGVMLLQFQQQGAAAYQVTHAREGERIRNLDDIYTDITVIYQDEDTFGSLDAAFMWHPYPYSQRNVRRNWWANRPDQWREDGWVYDDDPKIADPAGNGMAHGINDTFGGNQNTWGGKGIVDDNPRSTLTAWWSKNHVDYENIFNADHEWHHSYWWFDTLATKRVLNEIKIVIGDNRQGKVSVTVYGADNYDPSSGDPTINTPDGTGILWQPVSPELTRIGGESGDTETAFTFECSNFLYPQINILRITFDEISNDTSGDKGIGNYAAIIYEFFVRANKTKELKISLTNNPVYQYDPEYVYAPTTYNRLACIRPLTDTMQIGKASDQEALFLGRRALIESLQYYEARRYVYDGIWNNPKPRINETITTVDLQGLTYTGIIMEYTITNQRGTPNCQIDYTVLDYDSDYLGG